DEQLDQHLGRRPLPSAGRVAARERLIARRCRQALSAPSQGARVTAARPDPEPCSGLEIPGASPTMTTQMGQKRRGNVGWLLGSLGCVLLLGGGFVAYSELVPEEAAAPEVSPPPAVTGFSLGRNLEETARFLDGPYKLGVDRRFRFARGFQDSGELKAPAPWLQTFPEGHTFDPELP